MILRMPQARPNLAKHDIVRETLDVKIGPRHVDAKLPEKSLDDHILMRPASPFVVPKVLVLPNPTRNVVGPDTDVLPPGAASLALVRFNLSVRRVRVRLRRLEANTADADEPSGSPPDATPTDRNILQTGYLPLLYALYSPEPSPKGEPLICSGKNCTTAAGQPPFHYRCTECTGPHLFLCSTCIAESHVNSPFHRIERWDGTSLEPYTLREIGFTLRLGHNGRGCSTKNWQIELPSEAYTLNVMHTNGLHKVDIVYCTCSKLQHHEQLLMHGIYPATEPCPQTGFTFHTLDQFLRFNVASKILAYDYCHNMRCASDMQQPQSVSVRRVITRSSESCGWLTNQPQNLYKNFNLVARQWRSLKTLMKSGKLHNRTLKNGELVVSCPACPQPGVNIPDDWKTKDNK